MTSISSNEKLSSWERTKEAVTQASEKESKKSLGERLKEETSVPLYLYKGAIQGALKMLESGIVFNGLKDSVHDLRRITTDRKEFEEEKRRQRGAIGQFGKETIQHPTQKLYELWDGMKEVTTQKAIAFIQAPRSKQAEMVGALAPDAALSAIGAEETIAVVRARRFTNALKTESVTLKEIAVSEKIPASIHLKFNKERRIWTTPAGLEYEIDKEHGTYVKHVMAHLKPNPNKKLHTIFNVERRKLLPLIDEAWVKRGDHLPYNPKVYVVDTERVIGTQGETKIAIIVKPHTQKVISAYLWR